MAKIEVNLIKINIRQKSCFAGECLVYTWSGEERDTPVETRIIDLKPGDLVEDGLEDRGNLWGSAASRGEKTDVKFTAFRGFMHIHEAAPAAMRRIKTANGCEVICSDDHALVQKATDEGFTAWCGNADHGELWTVVSSIGAACSESEASNIIENTPCVVNGYCSPLTESGTLVVGGIQATCYTIPAPMLDLGFTHASFLDLVHQKHKDMRLGQAPPEDYEVKKHDTNWFGSGADVGMRGTERIMTKLAICKGSEDPLRGFGVAVEHLLLKPLIN